MLIPDRRWTSLTAEEQAAHRAAVQDLRTRRRLITCPHCHAPVRLDVELVACAPLEAAPVVEKLPPAVGSASDRAFLAEAQATGLLEAFGRAVEVEKAHSGVPEDLGAHLLTFWRTATTQKVPAILLADWIQEFGGFIEVIGSEGVWAVLSDGRLQTFVPVRLTRPASPSGGRRSVGISTAETYQSWRKGRFGYVPAGARVFGEALRQRNLGAFGALVP